MKIEKSDLPPSYVVIDDLAVGEEFVYDNNVYMKITPVSGGRLRCVDGQGGGISEVNAVKLDSGKCYMFREHKLRKVLRSKYTYSI